MVQKHTQGACYNLGESIRVGRKYGQRILALSVTSISIFVFNRDVVRGGEEE